MFGGNLVASRVGVTVTLFVPDPVVAEALAGAGVIAVMMALRSLDPPGCAQRRAERDGDQRSRRRLRAVVGGLGPEGCLMAAVSLGNLAARNNGARKTVST
ncbi:HPP family protein [Methylorubrum rhodesianum]|uniref:HPP family protein n=1 Tax=Methylorubrum rhodesianum TaxID=29427 RepID=UPI003D00A62B